MEDLQYIQKEAKTELDCLDVLIRLARYLRTPEGCPWDRRQTSRNFAEFLQNESVELLEAFDEEDNPHIAEEVGDCLFTLLACAAAAESEGRFQLGDVLQGIHRKMIRRHGHVFAAEKAATAEEAMDAWNRVKAEESAEKAARENAE